MTPSRYTFRGRRPRLGMTAPTQPDPVVVWVDETGQLMSDLGAVDRNCVVRVISGHCPDRHQCVLLYRAPGPRLLRLRAADIRTSERTGTYLGTPRAQHLQGELISIVPFPLSNSSSVDHVTSGGCPAAGDIGCRRAGTSTTTR